VRCLVTGATGFIGGAVLRDLQAAGHQVVAYVRDGSDSRSLQDIERIVGDLADPNRLAGRTSRAPKTQSTRQGKPVAADSFTSPAPM
jgi:nucleoside-diphosphate-sugar epimerase